MLGLGNRTGSCVGGFWSWEGGSAFHSEQLLDLDDLSLHQKVERKNDHSKHRSGEGGGKLASSVGGRRFLLQSEQSRREQTISHGPSPASRQEQRGGKGSTWVCLP